MAKDIKINPDGTIPLENGDLIIIEGSEEVAQVLRIGLKFFFGEWFLNNQDGIRYFEEIFIKEYSLTRISQIIRGFVNSIPEVIAIKDYTQEVTEVIESEVKKKKLIVSFTVSTEFGEVSINDLELP